MNFEPQTYEELIRMKRCVELTKYYEVTEEELWEIYHFLEQEPEAFIKGGRQNLSLIIGQNTAKTQKVIMANCTDSSIDGILLSRTEFKVFPHYTPSSGSGSSGGSSSNNNNNNNRICRYINILCFNFSKGVRASKFLYISCHNKMDENV